MNRPALLAEFRRDFLASRFECPLLLAFHLSLAANALGLTAAEMREVFA